MKRTCKYCGQSYDTEKGSQVFCDSNPNRGRGAKRWKPKPSLVTIGVLALPRSTFWPAESSKDGGG